MDGQLDWYHIKRTQNALIWYN